MEQDKFLSYLRNEKNLTLRSARDVISRINRAKSLVNVDSTQNYNKLIQQLERKDEFLALSRYVQPQIKRAIFLYKEYLGFPE